MKEATGLWTACSVLYCMMALLCLIGSIKFHLSCLTLTSYLISHTGIWPPWSWQGAKTLFPDLVTGAQSFEGADTPAFMIGILKWLREVHQWVAPAEVPTHPDPYQSGDLIWVSTPPLERTSKLKPRWIRPYQVHKIPNPYQATYGTNRGSRIVHIHHTKPALLDLLATPPALEDEPQKQFPFRSIPIHHPKRLHPWNWPLTQFLIPPTPSLFPVVQRQRLAHPCSPIPLRPQPMRTQHHRGWWTCLGCIKPPAHAIEPDQAELSKWPMASR